MQIFDGTLDLLISNQMWRKNLTYKQAFILFRKEKQDRSCREILQNSRTEDKPLEAVVFYDLDSKVFLLR